MGMFITIIGTIFSVVGALISICQANEAKKEANFVREVKRKMIDQRRISELTQIKNSFQRLQRKISKYGHAATPESLKGVNNQEDAQEIQEFILELQEHRSLFGVKNPNESDILCSNLTPLVEELANANDFISMHNSGKQILMQLSSFSSILKKKIDSKSIKAALE